jgi:hypothetical protein
VRRSGREQEAASGTAPLRTVVIALTTLLALAVGYARWRRTSPGLNGAGGLKGWR